MENWTWAWIVKDGRFFLKFLIAKLICNKIYIDIFDRRKKKAPPPPPHHSPLPCLLFLPVPGPYAHQGIATLLCAALGEGSFLGSLMFCAPKDSEEGTLLPFEITGRFFFLMGVKGSQLCSFRRLGAGSNSEVAIV